MPHRPGAGRDSIEALGCCRSILARGPSTRWSHLRRCRRCWSAGAATARSSGRRGLATHGCRCGSRPRRSPSGASGWQSSLGDIGRPAPSLSLLVLAHVDDDPRACARARRRRICAVSTGWRSSGSSAGPRSAAPSRWRSSSSRTRGSASVRSCCCRWARGHSSRSSGLADATSRIRSLKRAALSPGEMT